MRKFFLIIILLTSFYVFNLFSNNENKNTTIKKASFNIIPENITQLFKNINMPDYSKIHNIKDLRKTFKEIYGGTNCGKINEPKCLENRDFGEGKNINSLGLKLDNNAVMLFLYDVNNNYSASGNELGYGKIYYDVNGNAEPNSICEDRFVFNLYKNRISLDIMLPCSHKDEPVPFIE